MYSWNANPHLIVLLEMIWLTSLVHLMACSRASFLETAAPCMMVVAIFAKTSFEAGISAIVEKSIFEDAHPALTCRVVLTSMALESLGLDVQQVTQLNNAVRGITCQISTDKNHLCIFALFE